MRLDIRAVALAVVLGSAACGGAMATIVPSSNGLTTTYFENFDGGMSFSDSGRGWAEAGSDDFLWLTQVYAPGATYSFSSAVPIASVSLSFWYSVPFSRNGAVYLGPFKFNAILPDTPGTYEEFESNNPGAGGSSADSLFSVTLNNLPAGSYTLGFGTLAPGLSSMLKVDDVSLVVTVVPEPNTYALILSGLAAVISVARRRRRQPG